MKKYSAFIVAVFLVAGCKNAVNKPKSGGGGQFAGSCVQKASKLKVGGTFGANVASDICEEMYSVPVEVVQSLCSVADLAMKTSYETASSTYSPLACPRTNIAVTCEGTSPHKFYRFIYLGTSAESATCGSLSQVDGASIPAPGTAGSANQTGLPAGAGVAGSCITVSTKNSVNHSCAEYSSQSEYSSKSVLCKDNLTLGTQKSLQPNQPCPASVSGVAKWYGCKYSTMTLWEYNSKNEKTMSCADGVQPTLP